MGQVHVRFNVNVAAFLLTPIEGELYRYDLAEPITTVGSYWVDYCPDNTGRCHIATTCGDGYIKFSDFLKADMIWYTPR